MYSSSGKMPIPPRPTGPGNLLGTAIVGGIEWFIKRYGNVAAHSVLAQMPPAMQLWFSPNAPALGVLGARRYPYPVVGEVVRTMARVVKVPEDDLARDMAIAGCDATLGTVARGVLRHLVTPRAMASNAQSMWDEFHDSGRLVARATDDEYLSEVHEWENHDVLVCKMSVAVCAWLIGRMGKQDVAVTRVSCRAWGHDVCTTRVRFR